MEKHKFAEAAASFRASYAKDQSPRELYNVARAELAQGHFAEAAKLYRTYLGLPANEKMAPSERAEAKQELADITKNLTTLDVRAQGFTVDGVAGEGLIDVEPETHSVAMRGAEGPKTKVVVCAKGAVVLVEYAEPAKVVPAVPKTIDPPPAETREKGSWLVPGVLAGVGIVGVGIGVGLGAASSSATSTGTDLARGGACLDLASSACADAKDKERAASGMKTGSMIGYAVGGAFLVGGIVSALVIAPWIDRERKTAIWAAPSLGGMAFGGTF